MDGRGCAPSSAIVRRPDTGSTRASAAAPASPMEFPASAEAPFARTHPSATRQRRDGWHRQPPHSRGRARLARRGCRGPQPMRRAACTRRRRKVTNGGQRRTQPRYSEVLGASGEAQRTRQPDARRHSRSDRRQQPGPHAPTQVTIGACEHGCSRNAHEARRSAHLAGPSREAAARPQSHPPARARSQLGSRPLHAQSGGRAIAPHSAYGRVNARVLGAAGGVGG